MLKFWNKKEKPTNDVNQETEAEAVSVDKASIFTSLKQGLDRSSSKISLGITNIFLKKTLDKESLIKLEELLILSDIGVATSAKLVETIAKDKFDKEITEAEVKEYLAKEIENIINPFESKFTIDADKKPYIVLMIGVNGTGKTTAIGKLAYKLKAEGKKVMLAAGDTFRAAAVAQLKTWADRAGAEFISKDEGADPAALVYEAIDKAIEQQVDVLFIDTAGRLQNKDNLMEELKKINRVIKKRLSDAPHEAIIVLDATVGQNAHSQVELFGQAVDLTAMIINKMDGTAKGGVLVSLVEKFKLPVYAIGIGEKVEDLRDFTAKDFSRILVGLE